MEFVGEKRSVSRPGTDAERINPAETTDPESSATVNPQQPVTGPAQEAQQAGIAPQPGPSNPVHETHEELHLPEAAAQQYAGSETLQPTGTVSGQPGFAVESERRIQVGLPSGQRPGFTMAVRPNLAVRPGPSHRAQPVIPTIEPGLPVQEVGGLEGYLVEPEEPEHPQQPLQDYIIVFASQPSKHIICSYAPEDVLKFGRFDYCFIRTYFW